MASRSAKTGGVYSQRLSVLQDGLRALCHIPTRSREKSSLFALLGLSRLVRCEWHPNHAIRSIFSTAKAKWLRLRVQTLHLLL